MPGRRSSPPGDSPLNRHMSFPARVFLILTALADKSSDDALDGNMESNDD